jgi:hypothetical protein
MSDENRQLREQLDHELARLELTDAARRRFRTSIGERATRRHAAPRWPVPVVTAAVLVLIGVPGLAVRQLRAAPGAPAASTTVVVPAGPGQPSPRRSTTAPAPGTLPPTVRAVPAQSRPASTQAPSAATAAILSRVDLAVAPQLVTVGRPVVATVKGTAGNLASPLPVEVKRGAATTGPLRVDWGDGQSERQVLACPTGAAGTTTMVQAKHTYRRPGKYLVVVTTATTSCWGRPTRLTAPVGVS